MGEFLGTVMHFTLWHKVRFVKQKQKQEPAYKWSVMKTLLGSGWYSPCFADEIDT